MTNTSSPAWFPSRTYLFVPGYQHNRFDTAWDSQADAVILDLEDAVPPDRKEQARLAVADWLTPRKPVWIRCNAVDSPWFEADIALASHPGVAGFVLPKAERVPAHLLNLARLHGLGLIPLIETAQGIKLAEELALLPEVVRLAFGALDFQVDLGIDGDTDELLAFRSHLVLASRLANKLPPIDGVTPSIVDVDALVNDTLRARSLGFGARLCIHPSQIGPVHARLAPTPSSLEWAAAVVRAMEVANGSAVAVEGKMVDLPVLLRAKALLAAPKAGQRLRA